MQLADHHRDTDQTMSPAIYAALVGSLFQNPAPMFAGAVCAAIAAVMTALKTGNHLLWPCAVLLVLIGALRALRHGEIQEPRVRTLTAAEAAHWESAVSDRRDALRDRARRMVRHRASGDRRCGRAHDLHLGHHGIHGGRRRPHLRAPVDFPSADSADLRTDVGGDGAARRSLLHRDGASDRAVFPRPREDHDEPAADFRPRADRARTRSGARRSVRHRAEQHAAWPVHVRRRRPPGRDELSLQRNDASRRRLRASRRQCARKSSRHAWPPERCRPKAARTIISEIENSQAGDNRDRRSGYGTRPGAVVDVPADGRRRHGRAGRGHHGAAQGGSQDQPSRALRCAHGAAQPGQFPRRNRTPAGDFANSGSRLSALLFIDLDQFKQVNDTLGHPCGDRLLCMVADRLRGMLRPEDFVARFGGDEFVVFQQNIQSAEEAAGAVPPHRRTAHRAI